MGNSRIKWAASSSHGLGPVWAASHEKFATDFSTFALPEIEKIRWCSVASAAQTQVVLDVLSSRYPRVACVRFSSETPIAGFHNAYQPPASLGADRWAAAVGARVHQTQGAVLIASLGTATTLDILSAHNQFLGGLILPGVSTMQAALQQHTQMPRVAEAFLNTPLTRVPLIPNQTQTAIQHGILSAQWGALQYLHAKAEHDLKTPLAVMLTGGAAPMLQSFFETQWHQPQATALHFQLVDNLVLHGLQAIAMSHS